MGDKIYLFCDGGCRGNQEKINIGGWGAFLQYKGFEKELWGNTKNTTNNIMELTSAIEGLKAIKNKMIPVEVIMDSQYVVQGINTWIQGWINKNWQTKNKQPVKNKELWQELYNLKTQFKDINFRQILGHAGNYGNERADLLANRAMDELKD